MLQDIFKELEAAYDDMVSLRRDFHMNPELSFEEVQTPKKIAEYHRNLGLKVRTEVGGRGVVATLEGGNPGKTVALRADFDALPIKEENDLPYKSQNDGVMHACGHDGHTAEMLCLAKVLAEHQNDIRGNIVFIHQFAEEVTPGGAKPMIEDGCLDGVDAIFGTHLWSPFPLDTIGYRSGDVMANADFFNIEVMGKGGHGGMPHETVDAIVTASRVVSDLQQIVSRGVDPLKSAVVTVGAFHAGKAYNVVAEKASITGTVRTFDQDIRDDVEKKIEKIAKHTCEGAGADCEFTFERGYPAVQNHPAETEVLVNAAKQVVDPEKVFEMPPVMGGEDFAYYLKEVPGTFFFTGARNEEIGAEYPHHHPRFNIDERSMLIAAKTLAAAALQYLDESHQTTPKPTESSIP
ncbi:MAG TPA: M20 family metallopeptidase [Bacillales bacterium]|nr:M20 family metallopeptidase [Bacillales bacterium]